MPDEQPYRDLMVDDVHWTVIQWQDKVVIRQQSPRGVETYVVDPKLDFSPPPGVEVPNEVLLGARDLHAKLAPPAERPSRWSLL